MALVLEGLIHFGDYNSAAVDLCVLWRFFRAGPGAVRNERVNQLNQFVSTQCVSITCWNSARRFMKMANVIK